MNDFVGPFGMYEVDFYPPVKNYYGPLRAWAKLLVQGRGTGVPIRLIKVEDATGEKVADAYAPAGTSWDDQRAAAQWLLDISCVRWNVEGTEVKVIQEALVL